MLKSWIHTNIDKRFLLVGLVALAAVALIACTGSEGPAGAQGPMGPTGPQGPDGDVSALPGAFAATQQGDFVAVDNPAISEDDSCAFLTGTPDASICTFELEGSGRSNLLGDYTEKATWLMSVPALSDVGTVPGGILSGSAVFSSERGEIHFEAIGPVVGLNIVGPPDETGLVPGIINPGLPFKIVGGTNEFASATGVVLRTGTFTNNVIEPGAPGTYDISYVGSITF